MQYKVGDKVKILPSATEVRVPNGEVGKSGTITFITQSGRHMNITMDKPLKGFRAVYCWSINIEHIELLVVKGQQLLFNFMEE